MKEGAVDEGMSRLGVNTTSGLHTHTLNTNERAPAQKLNMPLTLILFGTI